MNSPISTDLDPKNCSRKKLYRKALDFFFGKKTMVFFWPVDFSHPSSLRGTAAWNLHIDNGNLGGFEKGDVSTRFGDISRLKMSFFVGIVTVHSINCEMMVGIMGLREAIQKSRCFPVKHEAFLSIFP